MEHILINNFGINKLIGAFILALICFIIFRGNFKNITKINNFIIPFLIIIILVVGFKNILNIKNVDINLIEKTNINWVLSSILYASYNLVLLIPILINLKDIIKNKKQILRSSIIVGVIITIISVLTYFLLINVDTEISKLEMPVVYSINRLFPVYSKMYGIIILIAIFTTAVSIGKSFLNNFCKNQKNYLTIAGIMCITSIIISNFGFANLVKTLFPLFGILGIFQIFLILKYKD